MAKPRPLITRLRAARLLVLQWRRTVYDSSENRAGPAKGTVTDRSILRELARFDEAYAALTEAIREEAKGPAMRPGRGLTTCDMGEDESL